MALRSGTKTEQSVTYESQLIDNIHNTVYCSGSFTVPWDDFIAIISLLLTLKEFENRSAFDEVTCKKTVATFLVS